MAFLEQVLDEIGNALDKFLGIEVLHEFECAAADAHVLVGFALGHEFLLLGVGGGCCGGGGAGVLLLLLRGGPSEK